MIGRSFAIVTSTGSRLAKPRAVMSLGCFAALKGSTSIFAVNSAPPSHAIKPGSVESSGGVTKNSAPYRLMKYRLPDGPPPPLQVNGANTRSANTAPDTARNVSRRHGRARSADASHNRIEITPGKKYG